MTAPTGDPKPETNPADPQPTEGTPSETPTEPAPESSPEPQSPPAEDTPPPAPESPASDPGAVPPNETQPEQPAMNAPAEVKPAAPVKRPIKIGTQRPGQTEVLKPRPAPIDAPYAATPLVTPAIDAPVPFKKNRPQRDMYEDDAADEAALEKPIAPEQPVAAESTAAEQPAAKKPDAPQPAPSNFPPPRLERISPELQKEIDDALGGGSIEQLLAAETGGPLKDDELELEERRTATVVKIDHENVFFLLGRQYEGFAPLRQFAKPPEVGATIEVVPVRFNQEENLYELTVPGAAIDVSDWADIEEGMIVEATVSAANTGGLEAKAGNLRAFIPASQVSLYHVDNLEEFVGKKLACVVTEANPERRNLVLSHRAVLEREREDGRQKLLEGLEVGAVREGVVRNIRDFGAFVDLGGVDGLIHVSKLSWDRVNHPSDVVKEGETVRVKIDRIDPATGKISLSLRDLQAQPWDDVPSKYSAGSIVDGTVSKIAEFGAFVRLEAGVEGLVHISEIAHHRVVRVNTHLQEGQEVQVKVLSVDPEAQRMSLSLKALSMAPQTGKKKEVEDDDLPPRESAVPERKGPLKGGTNKKTGGEGIGLNW